MTPELFEGIRLNIRELVTQGVVAYEKKFGKIKVDLFRQKFLDSGLELLNSIIDNVQSGNKVPTQSLKGPLLKVLFDLDFDSETIKNLIPFIRERVFALLRSQPGLDYGIQRTFDFYFESFLENIDNFSFYYSSDSSDILRALPQYQYSETLSSVIPKELEEKTNRIYTLFPSDRYWEVFSGQTDGESYSPLQYNRVASSLGLSRYQVNLNYQSLVIYNGKLYKLLPGVTSPTREYFEPSEWIEYSSRRFDKSKSFNNVLTSAVRSSFSVVSENGFDSNEIISDSKVVSYQKQHDTDETTLSLTFGGAGKQIMDSLKSLREISEAFGGYEGSPIGGVEYITLFSEYLLGGCFGRDISSVFSVSGGESAFGEFDMLFSSQMTENRIPGLKFLDKFNGLRSFVHSQKIPEDSVFSSGRVVYNPVYSAFQKGLSDRFGTLEESSSYAGVARFDLLLYALESLYRRCKATGDSAKAVLNTLDSKGRVPGYEGLGSVDIQMNEFQAIFPPTLYFSDLIEGTKLSAGITGSIRYLIDSYSKLSALIVSPVFPGDSLEFFKSWTEVIHSRLTEVLDVLSGVIVSKSGFIPNLSLRSFESDGTKPIEFLRSLGFRDSEVNAFLNAESFKDLVSNFAPLSDSSDIKSFFKAYELSQLIYEFGGQDAINAYLGFLYENDSVNGLLNILRISDVDKSRQSYSNLEKYPKLIGLLIGLTYAIDPTQLVVFNEILGNNNLTLLESISYLYQNGETTIVKSKDDVDLLQPLFEQMITGNYSKDALSSPSLSYEQVDSKTPIALKQWTEIISNNLGRVESSDIINGLYDRAIGLTPKEIVSILNNPDSSGSLGQLLDGFEGGKFTSFLRYASLSGLAIKLQTYKNSYQTENFEVSKDNQNNTVPVVLDNLQEVIRLTEIIQTIFNSELNYSFSKNDSFTSKLEPFVLSQNKEVDTISQVLTLLGTGESGSLARSVASNGKIVESPGTGNSRLPNRIAAVNSVTPEQAQQISSYSKTLDTQGIVTELPIKLISKFVKFSEGNLLLNGVNLSDENEELYASKSKPSSFSPATIYELEGTPLRTQSITPEVAKIYTQLNGNPNISSQSLGANYISEKSPSYGQLVKGFDPVSSCKKFGGSNCEDLYSNSQDRCVGTLNKSLLPETYSKVPGSSPSSVMVDRPLGTFTNFTPSGTLISTSSFNSPPVYVGLLPDGTSIGERGEPILAPGSVIRTQPIVYDSGGAGLSEYGNTEFGISEFIRAKLERNSEFNCAGFDSPFHYQVCMNVMKCKRFSESYSGKYYLDFCPRTLSGGRLK